MGDFDWDTTGISAGLYFFCYLYFQPPVHFFNRMVHDWVFKENVNQYSCPPLAIAANMFGECPPTLRHNLRPIFQHLICLGSDLHRGVHGKTILDALMQTAECPSESAPLGWEWIQILQECGVNIPQYLRTESVLHYDPVESLPIMQGPHHEFGPNLRKLAIVEEPPSISWE